MNDIEFTPLEDLSYEAALKELEELVSLLEKGENDLQSTLVYFERGQALAAHCLSLLDQAELKVEQILEEDANDAS